MEPVHLVCVRRRGGVYFLVLAVLGGAFYGRCAFHGCGIGVGCDRGVRGLAALSGWGRVGSVQCVLGGMECARRRKFVSVDWLG